MPTAIIKCSCNNEFQDKRYGRNMRVHNHSPGSSRGSKEPGWRCTVCLSMKPDNKQAG